MDLRTILLVLAALLPAIILCIYVFKKDRVEKEPVGLLLLLLGLGVLSCFPAAKIEGLLFGIIDTVFEPFTFEEGGLLYMNSTPFRFYHICENFIGVALVEEGLKWLILFFVTRNNKNFNYLFDGIIYAIFVSLGFAAYENILYVTEYGFGNALMRGILSVPGHMFFAVFMGYYYSTWNIHNIAKKLEADFAEKGIISVRYPVSSAKYLIYSLLIPVLAHGFYDYALSVDSWFMLIVFYLFVIGMYIYCFGKIKKVSNYDEHENKYALAILIKKYPHLQALFTKTK